jgi:hypothetical protein
MNVFVICRRIEIIAGVILISLLLNGCTGGNLRGFAKPEKIGKTTRIAVCPFALGDAWSDYASDCAGWFFGMYSDLNIIERKELTKLFDEQDLFPGRLNDESRARIRQVFGVEALVLGNAYRTYRQFRNDLGILVTTERKSFVMMRIVNSETGEIVANYYLRGYKGGLSDAVEKTVEKLCRDMNWYQKEY